MRSQLRFVMHPDDEQRMIDEILKEPSVVLIDGALWCESEHSTIQFLRSSLHGDVVTEGRFAISTGEASAGAAAAVERRFKALRKLVKKTYANAIVQWQNPALPLAPAGPSRSANPSAPDPSLWVGPAAMAWLRADGRRRIKQSLTGRVEGTLIPDGGGQHA